MAIGVPILGLVTYTMSAALSGGQVPATNRDIRNPAPNSGASNTINVLNHGVKGVGCANDDSPAIRAIFSKSISGRTIFFPPGRKYCFKSNVAPGYPAFNRTSVLVSGKSGFNIIAKNATFITHNSIPLTTTFTFDRATDWSWKGGTFVGNRTGLSADAENVAIGLANVQRFHISDAIFTGYGGNGAAINGDWIVSGNFSRLKMRGVGICFDLAFLKDVAIKDVVATGADTFGRSGKGQTGEKCFSTIQDGPLISYNRTGINIPHSDGVTVESLDASNFRTAVAVASGRRFRFINNNIHDNPGGLTAGLGYYFYYINGGRFSSAGAPVSDVKIVGGKIRNNGSPTTGLGMLIDTSTIKNGDVMDGFAVDAVQFSNHANRNMRVVGNRHRRIDVGKNVVNGVTKIGVMP